MPSSPPDWIVVVVLLGVVYPAVAYALYRWADAGGMKGGKRGK